MANMRPLSIDDYYFCSMCKNWHKPKNNIWEEHLDFFDEKETNSINPKYYYCEKCKKSHHNDRKHLNFRVYLLPYIKKFSISERQNEQYDKEYIPTPREGIANELITKSSSSAGNICYKMTGSTKEAKEITQNSVKQPKKEEKPWYNDPKIIIPAVVVIIAAFINPKWSFLLNNFKASSPQPSFPLMPTPSTTSPPTPVSTLFPTPTSALTSVPTATVIISPIAISLNVTPFKEIEINSETKQLAWSLDNKSLAIATYGLYLYDAQTFEQKLKIDLQWVNSVAFSPDNQTIATASYDGVKLWSSDGGELGTITNTKDAGSLAFSPDGTKLAVAIDMTIKLFDVATMSELNTFIAGNPVNTVSFSPDGKILASGGLGPGGGDIILWDVITGKKLHTLTMHSNWVNSVAFSPDGKKLASGSVDKTIKLWNVSSGSLLQTFTGHTDQIDSVAFSPDGKLLASASWDLTVRLWDVASGKELRILTGHTKWLNSVAFSPDGKLLASGANDEAVRLWRVET